MKVLCEALVRHKMPKLSDDLPKHSDACYSSRQLLFGAFIYRDNLLINQLTAVVSESLTRAVTECTACTLSEVDGL